MRRAADLLQPLHANCHTRDPRPMTHPDTGPTGAAAAPVPSTTPRWWTYGYVWLVLSGPLLVVVASLATTYIAYTRADPVVDENYYQKGLALSPALQGRDHSQAAHAPASLYTPAVKP